MTTKELDLAVDDSTVKVDASTRKLRANIAANSFYAGGASEDTPSQIFLAERTIAGRATGGIPTALSQSNIMQDVLSHGRVILTGLPNSDLDGISDCTNAIEDAIGALESETGPARLMLPAGRLKITRPLPTIAESAATWGGVTRRIHGAGFGHTVISYEPGSGDAGEYCISCGAASGSRQQVSLSDFTILGGAYGFFGIDLDHVTVSDMSNVVVRCNNGGTYASGIGLSVSNSNNLTFVNCEFIGQDGMVLDSCVACNFFGCRWDEAHATSGANMRFSQTNYTIGVYGGACQGTCPHAVDILSNSSGGNHNLTFRGLYFEGSVDEQFYVRPVDSGVYSTQGLWIENCELSPTPPNNAVVDAEKLQGLTIRGGRLPSNTDLSPQFILHDVTMVDVAVPYRGGDTSLFSTSGSVTGVWMQRPKDRWTFNGIAWAGDFTYHGSPEGNITAGVGSRCQDTSGGLLWIKTSGSGATGWSSL